MCHQSLKRFFGISLLVLCVVFLMSATVFGASKQVLNAAQAKTAPTGLDDGVWEKPRPSRFHLKARKSSRARRPRLPPRRSTPMRGFIFCSSGKIRPSALSKGPGNTRAINGPTKKATKTVSPCFLKSTASTTLPPRAAPSSVMCPRARRTPRKVNSAQPLRRKRAIFGTGKRPGLILPALPTTHGSPRSATKRGAGRVMPGKVGIRRT